MSVHDALTLGRRETAAGTILSLQGNVEQLLAAIAAKAELEAEVARKAEEESCAVSYSKSL